VGPSACAVTSLGRAGHPAGSSGPTTRADTHLGQRVLARAERHTDVGRAVRARTIRPRTPGADLGSAVCSTTGLGSTLRTGARLGGASRPSGPTWSFGTGTRSCTGGQRLGRAVPDLLRAADGGAIMGSTGSTATASPSVGHAPLRGGLGGSQEPGRRGTTGTTGTTGTSSACAVVDGPAGRPCTRSGQAG
jgi:hypothetical protein